MNRAPLEACGSRRYTAIAELLKAEAGIVRHYEFNKLGGLAWTGEGWVLAPAGVTRRQLYVLAHECGHIVLHSDRAGQAKPGHVKEHEAEVYAHRAFERYGLEVPEKSAKWARSYVGQWVMKDHAAGIPICLMAAEFASGRRSPSDPLPSLEGMPPRDFSKSVEKFVAKGTRVAEAQEQAAALPQRSPQSAGQTTPVTFEALRAPMTDEEEALLKDLMKTAKRLERRHVPGPYSVVANVIELVQEAKLRGQSALPIIARGLDALQRLRNAHRQERRASLREVFESETWAFALGFAAISVGFFLAGFGVWDFFHYVGGFFAALVAVLLVALLVRAAMR